MMMYNGTKVQKLYLVFFSALFSLFLVQNVFSANGEDVFPLSIGNSWVYKVTSNVEDAVFTITDTIIGTENINGRETFVIESRIDINNFLNKRSYFYKENGQLTLAKLTTYQIAPRGRTYGGKRLWDKGDIIENDDPYVPMIYLQYPLKEGQIWVSQGGYFTVIGKENVAVPAGTFECWKIKLEFEGAKGTIYKYYSDGVGLVKDETNDPTLSSISELIEYNISE